MKYSNGRRQRCVDIKKKLIIKTYYKYLLSYCIIFIVPLLFFAFFWNQFFLKTYLEDTYMNIRSDTKRFKDNIDISISKIYSNTYFIRLESLFFDKNITNAYDRFLFYEFLRSNTIKDEFIDNIIYLENESQYVITSRGVCETEKINRYLFDYKGWPTSDLLTEVYMYQQSDWRYSEEIEFFSSYVDNYLSFVCPVRKNYNELPREVFIFNINENRLFDTLNIDRKYDEKDYLIIDGNGEIVSSNSLSDYHSQQLIEHVLLNSSNEPRHHIYDEYVVSFIKSSLNDWIYINVLPVKVALSKINKMKNIAFLYIILVAVIGSVIIYLLTYLNYNPLKKLFSIISNLVNEGFHEKNAIETVKDAMQRLSLNANSMTEKYNAGILSIKNTMIYDAIRGNIRNIKSFNSQGQEYGICIDNSIFYIVVFYMRKFHESNLDKNEIIGQINDRFTNFNVHGIEGINENTILFFVSSDFVIRDKLRITLNDIKTVFYDKYGIDFLIGVSSEIDKEGNIHDAYIQAILSIENMDKNSYINKDDVVFYDDEYYVQFSKYPEIEIEKLHESLNNMSLNQFKHSSKYLLNYLENENISVFMAQCISYDILTIIFKFILKSIRKDTFMLELIDLLNIGNSSHNVESLREFLRIVCDNVERYIKSLSLSDDDHVIENMKRYIRENFTDPNFSLYEFSDKYSLSLSNASYYFKKESSQTFSEYISDLRLEKSKELLATTELSVNDIAKEVGYLNSSSFVRRFKQLTGSTPGEYREIFRT